MDITKEVARIRYWYHLEGLDLNNVLNQLKLRKDEDAERIAKSHCVEIIDCWIRLGKKVPKEMIDFYNQEKSL